MKLTGDGLAEEADMNIKNILPWKKDGRQVAVRKDDQFGEMHRQMQTMFDDFFQGFGAISPWGRNGDSGLSGSLFYPRVDVSETSKEVKITADLPGMDEKDLDISLTREALTIKGERKTEREAKDKDFHRVERSYGSFQRVIPLPCAIDEKKVEASVKNGVLSITLPKSEETMRERRQIPVKTG